MSILYDLGVDINREWKFKNGDLELAYYDENMSQAVYNRLSCWLNSMDIFYVNYGSNLYEYLGYKNKKTVHEYIQLEIEKRLAYDPRVKDCTVKVNKTTPEQVEVNITLVFRNGETYTDNYVIKNGGKTSD